MRKKSEVKAFTYILVCADGTLYTGWTNDLEKRLAAHLPQAGLGVVLSAETGIFSRSLH